MAIGAAAAGMMLAVRIGDGSDVGPFIDTNYPQIPGAGPVPVHRRRQHR